ncbi:AAA family ATPase [Collinsella sp. zg1085]|uniref:cytidylate kinase-like family protein n=1 Tax=Collinsella sp. zg1085 TaxID=2844380 RepID=UPI0035300F92
MGFFSRRMLARVEEQVSASDALRAGQPVVITIARDFGAEGHEIGKMLSVELGIPLYDNELLVRSSVRSGESLDKIAAYDERQAAEFMAFLPDRVDTRSLSDRLFKAMTQVILDLGATESCIIEGRLSDYLLRHNPNHIAVLVTAPFEERVEIVRNKRGLSRAKGAKLVREMQRARELFYKRYSAGRWKMTDGKDIVVNRAKLGRQGCVDVIAAAYRSKLAELEMMSVTPEQAQ